MTDSFARWSDVEALGALWAALIPSTDWWPLCGYLGLCAAVVVVTAMMED